MPAVSIGDEPAHDFAPFALIVTLPTGQPAPSAIEVERADQRWTAAAVRDSGTIRPDSAKYLRIPHQGNRVDPAFLRVGARN